MFDIERLLGINVEGVTTLVVVFAEMADVVANFLMGSKKAS